MRLSVVWALSAVVLLCPWVGARADEPSRRQIGQVVLEGVPEIDEGLRQRLMQYLEVRRASVSDIAEDGSSLLVATRFGATNQLHLVSMPMGMRKQLTFFEEPVSGGRFVPGSGGRRLIFRKDVGGNENWQLYALDLDAGRHALLTDGTSRHESASLARSGKLLAFNGNGRDGRNMDIYLKDLTSGAAPRRVWEVDGTYYPGEFSPDDSRLLVQQYFSERETRWHVLEVKTGEHKAITPETPALYYGDATWSQDGSSIYLTSDREGEFRKLYRLEPATGAWTCLTADIEWDVDGVAVDPASGGLAFSVNEDGMTKLYFADGSGGKRRAVGGLPPGIVEGFGFNRAGGVLGLTYDAATAPADAYVVTYPGGEVTRWTESEVGGLDTRTFVSPTLIRYATFDEVDGKPRMIPAFYFKGKGEGKRPVVIVCHGGPEAQSQPNFSSTIQFWAVELGLSVILPNVRGSTGYGRTFHQLDNDVKREDSVRDVGALLDWIGTQAELDASRIGIYGGSYGGYMVLGSLSNFPGRIKAGIDVVGIADFITFLERTSEYRRDLRRAEYGDERIPEVRAVLERISPLRNAHKITAALLVAHGQNDPRVPISEAEQIVAKMREMKRPVWFANALDEGHGFQKKPNRDLMNVLYAMFWQEQLLK